MPDPADRRRFFKELLGEAAQSAREVHHSLGPMSPLNRLESLAALGQQDDDPFEDRPAWLDRATVPAKPAQRTCTPEDLELLAVSEGLIERLDEVRALARHSVRLTHRPPDAFAPARRSRLGGEPDLPADVPWPVWQGLQLEFLGQIDLADISFPGSEAILPDDGLLLFFFDADGTATGSTPEHLGAARALHVPSPGPLPDDDEEDHGLARDLGAPVDLSVELVLPRVKAPVVQALDLDESERKAWRRLRLALALAQGVGPGPDRSILPAVHRFLGYADEATGDMPRICSLVTAGHDLTETGSAAIPDDALDTSRWRLLLQLSVDDELDPCWADFEDRLYLWADVDELRDGTLRTVVGLPR